LRGALELVEACPCEAGCPGCVGPIGEVSEDGKRHSQVVLRSLLSIP